VPHAFKLDRELAKKGLVIVMVESQMGNAAKEDVLGFLMQKFPKDFPTSDVFVTVGENGPFPSGSKVMPYTALVGADGRLVMIGNPGELGSELDDAIEAEVKKVETGWGKNADVRKARGLMYGKKKLGEAAAVLAAAESKVKDADKDDLTAAQAELEARYAALKNAVSVLSEEGRIADAKAAALDLQKAVKGKADWETEAAGLVARFTSPEGENELKLDKALTAILKSVGDKKPTEAHAKKLEEFAKKNGGTKIGARAEMLAKAAVWKDESAGGAAVGKEPAKPKEEPKEEPKPKGEGN
jgi:hypothetical protein